MRPVLHVQFRFAFSTQYANDVCLHESEYVFTITDSGSDGFVEEACELDPCGYYVWVGDNYVGGAEVFFGEDKFTFPVPYSEDQPCSSDFSVLIVTDGSPSETTWDVVNDEGDVVLAGKLCASLCVLETLGL